MAQQQGVVAMTDMTEKEEEVIKLPNPGSPGYEEALQKLQELQKRQRRALAAVRRSFEANKHSQWLNAITTRKVSRGGPHLNEKPSPLNSLVGHALQTNVFYTIGDPSSPSNQLVETLNRHGHTSLEAYEEYMRRITDAKIARRGRPPEKAFLTDKIFKVKADRRQQRVANRKEMKKEGTWTDELEAVFAEMERDEEGEMKELREEEADTRDQPNDDDDGGGMEALLAAAMGSELVHRSPPTPIMDAESSDGMEALLAAAMGSELVHRSPPTINGDPPLYVPFNPIDMNEYFPMTGDEYRPGEYLGPSTDTGKPRLEFMKLYEWNSEVQDVRPKPVATPPDLYDDVPFNQLDHAGQDNEAFEHLCDRIKEEVDDLDYMFDLVYRMATRRDELEMLHTNTSAVPAPGAPTEVEKEEQQKVNTTGHEDGVGPTSPDDRPSLTSCPKPQSPTPPTEEGGKPGNLQPPTEPSGNGNGGQRGLFSGVAHLFQGLSPWSETEDQKKERLRQEAEKEKERLRQEAEQEKQRIIREKEEQERKQMLERQENARKRQEEMEKQRRAEFRNWMVDDFIVIEDCTGKKRWVVADSNVQVPKDVRYLDDSEYRFTPDIDSKPLDEYRDPRELYVTDDRPAGGFLCEHFSECNCFRKPPAQLPKTVLFTTADGRGIGLRALRSIKKGEYIGEYRGVIEVYDNNEKRPDVVQAMKNRDMRYAIGGHWDADTEFGVDEAGRTKSFSYYIDALKSGTETRFINHHCDPKVVNVEYVDENHKGRMVQAIRTTKLIPKGWEILIDYGTFDDWHSYGGHCLCRSNVCRYLINAGARSPYVVAIQMPSDEWSMVQLVPDPEIKPFKAGARLRVAKQKCSYHLRYERFKRRQKPVEHKKPRHELSVWPNVRIKVLYQQHLRAGVKERDSRYVWKQVRASVKEADDGDGE